MDFHKQHAWAQKVGTVFTTLPRDGTREDTVWRDRKELATLVDLLLSPGKHICVDGPTGTGKSSLVTTALSQTGWKYILIQITKNMSWPEFCRRLVTPPGRARASAELEMGFKGPLPEAKLRVSLAPKSDKSTYQIRSDAATYWTENDVCDAMAERRVALFLDDFERASDSLLERVSDLIKLLTQSINEPRAKLIIVGTDDVYARLLRANYALEDRLQELSLGTFEKRWEAHAFLGEGFRALGLIDPWNNEYLSKDDQEQCSSLMFDAADGLPKSLNQLGYNISTDRDPKRRRISLADVEKHSNEMLNQHLRNSINAVPEVIRLMRSNTEVRLILDALYGHGIGQAIDWRVLVRNVGHVLTIEQIDAAISDLVRTGILTRTGAKNEVLYPRDPTFVHTLGVIVRDPVRCGLPEEFFGKRGQLSLPFGPL